MLYLQEMNFPPPGFIILQKSLFSFSEILAKEKPERSLRSLMENDYDEFKNLTEITY